MFKVILWDVDGTLLNFDKAEKYALRQCFAKFNLKECTDAMISRYAEINKRYWKRLEAGEITKEQVLLERFSEFSKRNISAVTRSKSSTMNTRCVWAIKYFLMMTASLFWKG